MLHGLGQRSRYSNSLRAGWSGDQIPVGGEIFHTCPDRSWDQSTSYAMDTGSFPGLNWPKRGVDLPHASSADVKEREKLYLYSSFGHSWPVRG